MKVSMENNNNFGYEQITILVAFNLKFEQTTTIH
jgi:hypothetical protein